eukprot:COSAG01_NODE_476_length_16515_cov_37.730690_14_plen_85_part_00
MAASPFSPSQWQESQLLRSGAGGRGGGGGALDWRRSGAAAEREVVGGVEEAFRVLDSMRAQVNAAPWAAAAAAAAALISLDTCD